MEQFVEYIISLNPFWIYVTATTIAYIENIFPPFPSDVILIAAGYLCASGNVDFSTLLALSTISSLAGFITMYKVGEWFGLKIIESNRFNFLQLNKISKVSSWFNKYGYYVVVANRFLAGTRAVISFFTGMSRLSLLKTSLLAALSSLVWNFILIFSGKKVGENWREIAHYFAKYGQIVTILTIIVIILFIARNYIRKHRNSI